MPNLSRALFTRASKLRNSSGPRRDKYSSIHRVLTILYFSKLSLMTIAFVFLFFPVY
nr:MAG TPA: hypothetical protein [Caudoviricetes sp.]